MKKNFKLVIEYDGTDYHGWQRQKDAVTVQATIENAVFSVTREKISLLGSGRTDAGVHALGQTANFLCETRLSAHVMKRALNSLLPNDIVIRACEPAPESFHARYDAKSKRYRYFFLNAPHPSAICRRHAWHIPRKLDMDAMADAARQAGKAAGCIATTPELLETALDMGYQLVSCGADCSFLTAGAKEAHETQYATLARLRPAD